MEQQDRRRKFKRYPARWKVAVVFDKAAAKPVLHTDTHDLSIAGTAIVSRYGDLTGMQVTLLLARPVRPGAEPPKMIKLRAQVVSSVHSAAVSGYRHGLRFVPSNDDGLSVLAGIIEAVESARRGRPAPAQAAAPAPVPDSSAAQPAPATPVSEPAATPAAQAEAPPEAPPETFRASPGSLLARLREQAQAKLAEEKKPEQKNQFVPNVSAAVEKTYRHLKEVVALLDTVKPDYARAYAFHGLPDFDELKWMSVHLDFRTREISPTSRVFEQVTLHYHLAAKKVLSVVREIPLDGKLKRMLDDARIEYSTQEERNNRGALAGTKFVMPCEVRGALQLDGNFDTGKLMLKLRNVGQFGTAEHVLAPEAVTPESLQELAQFILGETRRIGGLVLKAA